MKNSRISKLRRTATGKEVWIDDHYITPTRSIEVIKAHTPKTRLTKMQYPTTGTRVTIRSYKGD